MSEGINIAEAYDKGRALFMGIELLVAPGARPHFRAALAAARADEVRFDVGQPHMMGPAVGAERDVVAAAVDSTLRTPDARSSANVIFCEVVVMVVCPKGLS